MKKKLMGWILVWSAVSALGLGSTRRTVRPLSRARGPAHKNPSALAAVERAVFQALEEAALRMRKSGKQEGEGLC